MDINPDGATQDLTSKEDLASAAEDNGGPKEPVERLRTPGHPAVSGPEEVVAELESSPTSG